MKKSRDELGSSHWSVQAAKSTRTDFGHLHEIKISEKKKKKKKTKKPFLTQWVIGHQLINVSGMTESQTVCTHAS